MGRFGRFVMVGLALASQASFAQAQPPGASPVALDPAAAEALFREGRRLVTANDFAAACPKFEESHRLDPAVGTLLNWAACEERLGRLASAWQRWNEALDVLPPSDDRVEFARARAVALERRLPKLAIVFEAPVPGATVVRDDVELGPQSLGMPLPIDPGAHRVVVRLAGRVDQEVEISLREGESKRLQVTPGPPIEATQARDPHRVPAIAWVAAGAGAAGVVTALVTGLMLASEKNTVEEHCPGKVCTNQEGLEAAHRGQRLLVVNTAAWVVGGLGAGGAAYFLLRRTDHAKETALVAGPTLGGVSLQMVGTF